MCYMFNLFKKIRLNFFYLYIYPPDSQEMTEALIHRVGNHSDLLPEMPKILLSACNLIEI